MLPIAVLAAAWFLTAALPIEQGAPQPPHELATPGGAGALRSLAAEPPNAPLWVGDRAPDFSFQSLDEHALRLRDLLAQGHVLLVFTGDDGALRTLQRERDALLDLGVLPVAVVPMRNGAARALRQRLELSCQLVPDSRRVVAGQFDALDETGQSALPSYFVVDRAGRVRALSRAGLPENGWPRLAATVLAIPPRDGPLPAATR